jgi:hypothetical protein
VIVAGAVLDAAALICSPGDGCGKLHQRSRADTVAVSTADVVSPIVMIGPGMGGVLEYIFALNF